MRNLPEEIRKYVGTEKYTTDSVGMSGASILIFRDMVLKVERESEEADREAGVMKWLKGRLPVPEVICHKKQEGMNYLLMTKAAGEMSCHKRYMEEPQKLTAILAEGLEMLWQVDLSGFPFDCGLDKKLEMARVQVENHLVDLDNVEPETFGKGGFADPAELLDWLVRNRPEEEPVFSHGDFCLPNIFVKDGKVSGFIDLGRAGVMDKYQDIALGYRSLKHNYEGKYRGEKHYEGYCPEELFGQLGIRPDLEKIRYYILLDELF